MILRKSIQTLILTVLILGTVSAQAARYEIVTGKQSEIVFKSKAPLEKFQGKTRQLTGFFEADLDDLRGPVSLEVEVDLASFDTGKKKRNRHMCENHLETEKFPKAWFRAGEILQADKPSLASGESATLVLNGTLDLHGVKKPHDVTLQLTCRPDGSVLIRCEFKILLSDHEIDRPKFLVMKLADEQQVEIELLAKPAANTGRTQ